MAYLRKYQGGHSIKRKKYVDPDQEIVAHVVMLCRSGNYDAIQIREAVIAAFPGRDKFVVDASIGDACRRLLKQWDT